MNIIDAIFLGILQGLTEFLPVSSSGHLVIAQHFMGINEGNLALNVLLHLGTLVAIVIVYFKSVTSMIIEFFAMMGDLFRERSLSIYKSKYRKYIMLIVMASIPTAIIGLLFDDVFEELFSSIQVVAFTLILTGILLVLGEKLGKKNQLPIERLTLKQGILVGLFQSLAITPGISRSGSTIVGGLFNGLKKEEATEFSFLISIPAVLGAVVFKGKDILSLDALGMEGTTLGASFLAAVIFGVLAIKLLVKLVRNGKLHYFSYYCWAMSAILLINVYVLA
ncbi:undecaprenyl-diphosphate phosphatase [Alkalibacter rhizosphaerae]|uniref:Undecaprenyl-diphosphatase n=1 Tax=Alkalibacter rhizosphaerae TaxID=2815577 RepID=A0A974XEY0_9FIRM|nr:undecaprenyl-diphosphate phosphatase [Alkalibacter rhizosphaerae]QSX08607.1 undecaprenyl-diphosphate phosphatase [Alkalibacter rhizosphaerae]